MSLLGASDATISLDTVRTGTALADLIADVDIVIEAIAEDLELKQQLFSELDRTCAERTILASTTDNHGGGMIKARC